jgi:hypothetical protein
MRLLPRRNLHLLLLLSASLAILSHQMSLLWPCTHLTVKEQAIYHSDKVIGFELYDALLQIKTGGRVNYMAREVAFPPTTLVPLKLFYFMLYQGTGQASIPNHAWRF